MKFHSFWAALLLSLMIVPTILYPTAQNTDQIYDYLEPLETPIPVEIKLWGFETSVVSSISDKIPDHLIQEAFYPNDNKYDQSQLLINGVAYGISNNIELTVTSIPSEDYGDMIVNLTSIADTNLKANPNNQSDTYFGRAIDPNFLKSTFSQYSMNSTYTLHLANFSSIDDLDNNIYHWFDLGTTLNLDSGLDEMRNVYNLGGRQILYDPTAVAPYFGVDRTVRKLDLGDRIDNIIEDVVKLIEHGIVGSPQSNWFLPVEPSMHIARVLIKVNPADVISFKAGSTTAYSFLNQQVNRIFTGFDLVQSDKDVDLPSLEDLNNFLTEQTVQINGSPAVIVDSSFAETFKTEIRENMYQDFPSRYYIGLFLFADNERNYYLNSTNGLIPYQVGEIGFSIESLKNLFTIPSTQVTDRRIVFHSLKLLGHNFGLPVLNETISMQIDSPMSEIGVSNSWNNSLTPEEEDMIQRRYALALRTQMSDTVNQQLDDLSRSAFFWVNKTGLEMINQELIRGQQLESELKYEEALSLYNNLIEPFEQELEQIRNAKNFVNYGLVLLSAVILLGYYIKILNEESITKDEFKQRIEKLRKFNLEKSAKKRKDL